MGKKKIFIAVLILLVIGFPVAVKAGETVGGRNLFYVQVVNYCFPMVKSVSFNEEDMAEGGASIYDKLLTVTGTNFSSPLCFLGKEASYLQAFNSEAYQGYNIDYFKLSDKQVALEGSDTQEIKNVNTVDPTLKKQLNTSKPEVLIYHTHTSESYLPGNATNTDDAQNVVAVGDELVKELQNNYGISALNDRTVHDAAAYTQSYARSAVTFDSYMKKYGDFKLIIDLHRDSVSSKNAVTMKINGESVAKIMLVMSRKNPHFNKNMALANKLIQNSDKLFPGFCKGVCYYNYGTRYFNQDKSNNAVLIEVGADINTTTESKASAKYIARIIAESLK
ncbi:MAG: stage II sporulation protein P [Solirubrobacterales bacterium]